MPSVTSVASTSRRHQKKSHPIYAYLICINAAAFGLCYGFVFTMGTGILKFTTKKYDPNSLYWMIKGSFYAQIISSIPAAIIADNFGRKHCLLLSAIITTIGSSIAIAAVNVKMEIAGLIINGFGSGLAHVIAPIYIAECAPKEIRGFLFIFYRLMFSLGGASSYFLTAFLYDFEHGLRVLVGITAAISIIQMYYIRNVPESPRYLIWTGQIDTATEVLGKIRAIGHSNTVEARDIETFVKSNSEKTGITVWTSLITKYHVRRVLILCICMSVAVQLSGISAIMIMSRQILVGYGFKKVALMRLNMAPLALYAVGTTMCLQFVDTIGRKRLLAYSYYVCAISTFIISIGFFIGTMSSPTTSRAFDGGSTGVCSRMRSCLQCVEYQMVKCSYCAPTIDLFIKGSCVESEKGPDGLIFAKDGRCARNSTSIKSMKLMDEACPNNSFNLYFIGFIIFMIGYSSGAGPVPTILAVEMLPLWARTIGFSVSKIANLMTKIVVIKIFKSIGISSNSYGLFFSFAVITGLAGMYLTKYLHETMGTPIEWIDCMYMTGSDRKKFVDHMISNRILQPDPMPAPPPPDPEVHEEKTLIHFIEPEPPVEDTSTDPDAFVTELEMGKLRASGKSEKSRPSEQKSEHSKKSGSK